jgi:aminoglycoside phosphotransferase (APT) family kinase protein
LPGRLLDGLTVLTERAPLRAQAAVPVHADCHWGNWLACDRSVTALLDFEWARFGEPADDWFFRARFSGRHRQAVLDVISDIRIGLERPATPSPTTADRVHDLEELIIRRSWWRHGG